MTMAASEIEALARELKNARESGEMVCALPSARPGFDLDAAYQVEGMLKKWREADGFQSIGRKVGYANKAMWRVLKLETLVWGHMYEDTVHYSSNNSATISIARPRSLKIEPEIVFGVKDTMWSTEAPDAATALMSAEWFALGFEIIDCPYPDWKFTPGDFVASYGLHAALVVGQKVPVRPGAIASLVEELARFRVRMSKNGLFAEDGSGKNSLKNPALCLGELGAAIARRFPEKPLAMGDLVSSGTLTAGHATTKGDEWRADPEAIALPSLTVRLT